MSTQTLVQACRADVQAYPGGIEAVARKSGVRSLQQKLNEKTERNKVTLEDLDKIMAITRTEHVLDVVCQRHHAAWIDLSKLESLPCDASMLDNITELVTRVGNLTANVQTSLADGEVDTAEMIELEKANMRLVQASLAVVERSRQFMVVEHV